MEQPQENKGEKQPTSLEDWKKAHPEKEHASKNWKKEREDKKILPLENPAIRNIWKNQSKLKEQLGLGPDATIEQMERKIKERMSDKMEY